MTPVLEDHMAADLFARVAEGSDATRGATVADVVGFVAEQRNPTGAIGEILHATLEVAYQRGRLEADLDTMLLAESAISLDELRGVLRSRVARRTP